MLIEQQKDFKYLIVLLTGCTPNFWWPLKFTKNRNARTGILLYICMSCA